MNHVGRVSSRSMKMRNSRFFFFKGFHKLIVICVGSRWVFWGPTRLHSYEIHTWNDFGEEWLQGAQSAPKLTVVKRPQLLNSQYPLDHWKFQAYSAKPSKLFPKTSGLRTKTPRGRERKNKGKSKENNHSWQFIQKPSSPRCKAVQQSSYSKVEKRLSRTTVLTRTAMVLKFSRTKC